MARKETMTAKPTVRDYTGFGSGAATPDPNQPETIGSRVSNRGQAWTPTVSRQRGGTYNPEQPAARATAPVTTRSTRTAPPVQGPSFKAVTGNATSRIANLPPVRTASSILTGVSDAYDTTARTVSKAASGAAEAIPMGPLRKPAGFVARKTGNFIESSYGGALGKAFLAGDVAMVVTKAEQIFNPDDTAQMVFDANPGMFSSVEDAKAQTQAYNTGAIAGAIADNMINIGVSHVVGRIGAIGLVTALGEALPIGAIGGPIGIAATLIATMMIYTLLETANRGNAQVQDPTSQVMKAQGITPDINLPLLGNPTSGTQVSDFTASSLRNFYVDTLSNVNQKEPNQNSKADVMKMRSERNPMVYQDYTADGEPLPPLTFYQNFGSRTQEVRSLLLSGYFIHPTGEMMDVPDGKGGYKQIRQFDMNYEGFLRWFEDSDWVANPTGIRQRVVSLPRISPNTITAAQKQPISVEEAAYALKSWYDSAGFTIK